MLCMPVILTYFLLFGNAFDLEGMTRVWVIDTPLWPVPILLPFWAKLAVAAGLGWLAVFGVRSMRRLQAERPRDQRWRYASIALISIASFFPIFMFMSDFRPDYKLTYFTGLIACAGGMIAIGLASLDRIYPPWVRLISLGLALPIAFQVWYLHLWPRICDILNIPNAIRDPVVWVLLLNGLVAFSLAVAARRANDEPSFDAPMLVALIAYSVFLIQLSWVYFGYSCH